MIHTGDTMMKSVPLNSIVFQSELPAVLGISLVYCNQLISSMGSKGKFKHYNFPKPFYVSPSGIRIWRVRDLERWVYSARRYRQGNYQHKLGSTLIERKELADYILGR
jgi:hypothetical protein